VKQQRSGMGASEVASIEIFAPALRRYFAKRAPRSDIEDLVQEVLLRMHGRRSEAGIANLQGYVFTVAANVLKERRWRPGPFRELEIEACVVSDGITPERIVVARLEAMRLMAAIDALPRRTREIFVAHRFEEMTYGAIASLFGISVSAVEKHIMAALKSLSATVNGID
jgi:RNA polymerase sigma factor (sigma-70 family)